MAVASAAGGLLLAPAVLPAADDAPPGQEPLVAQIEADANPVPAGTEVELDASGTTGAAGEVRHTWDLDGDGLFEEDSGAEPTAKTTPEEPGTVNVKVRVLDGEGRTAEADLDLVVEEAKAVEGSGEPAAEAPEGEAPAPAEAKPEEPKPDEPKPEPDPAPRDEQPADAPAAAAPQPEQAAPAPEAPAPSAKELMDTPPLELNRDPRKLDLRLAASKGVTIQNFAFSPRTVSVNVGDTVTWTNRDDAPHNAVASGGFKTALLKKGQSGSATFSTAGSFAYICTVHPSMKGTVEVVGAGSSAGGGGEADSDAGAGDSAGATDEGAGGLPQTGRDIVAVVLVGLLLFMTGELLRRFTPHRPS